MENQGSDGNSPALRPKGTPEMLTALLAALTEFQQTGVTSLRCDSCGELIAFDDRTPRFVTYACGCGKYKGTLKGL